MNNLEIHHKAAAIHRENTDKVSQLLGEDYDLRRLHEVVGTETAEIYRRLLPRHAKLCELDQERGLNDTEKAELAFSYASLYPTFGDEGIVALSALWLGTRHMRQAKNS